MFNRQKVIKRLKKALPFVGTPDPLVSVIELRGAIGVGGPGARNIAHQTIEKSIIDAFKPAKLTAVALVINSPGGSPVQSRLIHRTIRREAEKKTVPVYAFIEDVGASGGYLLALAADEIYADTSSIIGSIGVISSGFGFQDAIAKIGIERRVYTSGRSKSQLDPFKAESSEDLKRLQDILEDTHAHFQRLVMDRRGGALGDQDDIFSGAFWTAQDAQKRGLIDGQAHLTDFMKEKFGDHVKVKKSASKHSILKLLTSKADDPRHQAFAENQPALLNTEQVLDHLEVKALWGKFGL